MAPDKPSQRTPTPPLTEERIGKPWGIQCFGCNRRFVGPGSPTSGPLDAVAWEEGLCGREECPVWEMMGVRVKENHR